MNARSNSRIRKGSVLNTKYAALSVAWMGEATRLFRFLAMWSTSKVRAFTPQKRGSLFGFRFLRSYGAKSSLSNLFACFWRNYMVALRFGVTVTKMFFGSKTFKILNSVVSFIAVDMVNVFSWLKRLKPTRRDNSVHQPLTAQSKIAHVVNIGRIRLEISENFSATRDGKKMVEESVFDSVYFDANHVVPLCS